MTLTETKRNKLKADTKYIVTRLEEIKQLLHDINSADRYILDKYDIRDADIQQLIKIQKNIQRMHIDISNNKM